MGTGYAFQLLDTLKEHFKFDYRIILPKIDNYSTELEAMLTQLSNEVCGWKFFLNLCPSNL